MNTPAIEARGVAHRFGEVLAVDGVDLVVQPGEIFGLIGHNGAGKSTLFRIMLGLLRPDAGAVRIRGEPVGGAGFRELRRRIGYLPENVVFYENLSGLETLRFFAELKGADPRDCPALLEQLGLGAAARRPVRGYSKGMRQRLGFAQALLGAPELLFLDEPTTGLDPEATREFYSMLEALKARGVTAILSSHHLAEIQERVDRLALMRSGRIGAVGTVQALREALALPLHVQLALRNGGAPAVEAALAGLEGLTIAVHGGSVNIRCARGEKMRLIARLAALDGAVADIHIQEPSLEDVFLGYAEG